MKPTNQPLEIARKTRLLLDRLAVDAAKAEDIAKKLPEPEPDEEIAAIHQAPTALRAWSNQLAKDYRVARDEYNDVNESETTYKATLDKARDLVRQANEARNEIKARCGHRIRLEDPIINSGNGAAIYPNNPTCIVCDERFELEWYCQESRELRCKYPHPAGGEVYGDYVEELCGDEKWNSWATTVQCVFCGEPWARER